MSILRDDLDEQFEAHFLRLLRTTALRRSRRQALHRFADQLVELVRSSEDNCSAVADFGPHRALELPPEFPPLFRPYFDQVSAGVQVPQLLEALLEEALGPGQTSRARLEVLLVWRATMALAFREEPSLLLERLGQVLGEPISQFEMLGIPSQDFETPIRNRNHRSWPELSFLEDRPGHEFYRLVSHCSPRTLSYLYFALSELQRNRLYSASRHYFRVDLQREISKRRPWRLVFGIGWAVQRVVRWRNKPKMEANNAS
ncbi:MAG: hypothetical protein WCG80_00095 [Spirochaetales bacterium]